MIIETGFLIGGAVLAASRFLKRNGCSNRVDERLEWCSWCEAPKGGHEARTLKCPARWMHSATGKLDSIHFFKPMTVEEWFKREGVS